MAARPRFKPAVYEQIARIGKALASPARLELLDLLAQGPRTVEALARGTAQSMANASHHLQALRSARLVEAEKTGVHVTYRLADPEVSAFVVRLRRLAHLRLAEIERLLEEQVDRRDPLHTLGPEDLLRRVRAGEVTLLDVRPAEEYAAGHIPGALSVPLPTLHRQLRRLPRRGKIVAYCRGPYCVMARDAVALLRRRGFRAQRMDDGVAEWRADGGRLETARPSAERRR